VDRARIRAPIFINQTTQDVGFRALFDAALCIRKTGEQISGKLGRAKLQAGDFLLTWLTGLRIFSVGQHNQKLLFICVEQKNAQESSKHGKEAFHSLWALLVP